MAPWANKFCLIKCAMTSLGTAISCCLRVVECGRPSHHSVFWVVEHGNQEVPSPCVVEISLGGGGLTVLRCSDAILDWLLQDRQDRIRMAANEFYPNGTVSNEPRKLFLRYRQELHLSRKIRVHEFLDYLAEDVPKTLDYGCCCGKGTEPASCQTVAHTVNNWVLRRAAELV